LYVNGSRASKGGVEQTFSTENGVLDSSNEFNIVIDIFSESYDATYLLSGLRLFLVLSFRFLQSVQMPVSSIFCIMNPSPPKNPRPNFLENSIPTDTPSAKESFF
jgi:hypothetical protein